MKYVKNWLKLYAPERVKFGLIEDISNVELNQNQKQLLINLADNIEAADKTDAQWYHEKVHELREDLGLKPKEAFQAIYRVLIGKDFGPKAGWYLSVLDQDWLVKRLRLES